MAKEKKELNIVMISTYPPKECGIATYAQNLFQALKKTDPDLRIIVLAIDELDKKRKYSEEARQFIKKEAVASYEKAAEYINNSGANIVYLQHEFGIFGGFDGTLILNLLEKLKIPVVVSLHTVPITKNSKRREMRLKLLKDILRHCKRAILTTKLAKETLTKEAGISGRKVRVIYHGTPDVKYVGQKKAKEDLGLEGKKVLSTIGLINTHKGVDLAVEALPEIIKKHKDVIYLIAGSMHSSKRKEVEEYLKKAMDKAKELKVEKYIKRIDKYFTEEELIKYFQASDIYLTVYDGAAQVSSGTLAYAFACGRCIVSTPYIYAKEMIGKGERGFLVKFNDSKSVAEKVNYILDHPKIQKEMEKKVYEFGRRTVWSVVAKQHFEIFKEAVSDYF